MKKILFSIFFALICAFSVVSVDAQVSNLNFCIRYNVSTSTPSGNNYTISGNVSDFNGVWDASFVNTGDTIYYLDENILFALSITSISVQSNNSLTCVAASIAPFVSTSSIGNLNGQLVISRKTIKGYCPVPAGSNEYLKSAMENRFKQQSTSNISNIDNTSDANKPISTATQTALNAKQANLVSGTNLKTVNGTSLLGSGDLVISGGTPSANSVDSSKIINGSVSASDAGQSLIDTISNMQKDIVFENALNNYATDYNSVEDENYIFKISNITDSTLKQKSRRLIRALKYHGLWNKLDAFYPFVGGTETAHKINWKKPTSDTLAGAIVFRNAVHSTGGVDFAGGFGYFRYGYGHPDLGLSIYSLDDVQTSYGFIRAGTFPSFGDLTGNLLRFYTNNFNTVGGQIGDVSTFADNSLGGAVNGNGLMTLQRNTDFPFDSVQILKNGVYINGVNRANNNGVFYDSTAVIVFNHQTVDAPIQKQISLLAMHRSFTRAEYQTFNTIIAAFQSEMGRQDGSATQYTGIDFSDKYEEEKNFYVNRLPYAYPPFDAAAGGTDGVMGIEFNGKDFLYAGWNQGTPAKVRVSTDDGATWTSSTITGMSERHGFALVVHQNKIYIIGSDAQNPNNDVWVSSDGIAFTKVVQNAEWGKSYRRYMQAAVSHNNALYVIGGQTNTVIDSTLRDVWKSVDNGKTWKEICSSCLPTESGNHTTTTVVSKGYMVMVGTAKYDDTPANRVFSNKVFRSQNGVDWAEISQLPDVGRMYRNVTVDNNGTIYAFGGIVRGTNNTGDALIYSNDAGVTWHRSYLGHSSNLASHADAFYVSKGRLVVRTGNYGFDLTRRGQYEITKGLKNEPEFSTTIVDVSNKFTIGGDVLTAPKLGTTNNSNLTLISNNADVVTVTPTAVGVNNVSPSATLDVTGDARFGGNTAKLRTYSDAIYSGIFNGTTLNEKEGFQLGSSQISTIVNGAERMRILSNGNVGIGITSPSTPLDVFGVATFGSGTTKLRTYSDASSSGFFNGASLTSAESFYMGSSNRMFFATGGVEAIRVNSNQFVGFGTGTTPHRLTILGNIALTSTIGSIYHNTDLLLSSDASGYYFANTGNKNVIIGNSTTNSTTIKGLQPGATTDSIVTSAGGVLKRMTLNGILGTTTSSLRVPRLTTTQRDALNGAAGSVTGDIIYNSTLDKYQLGNASATWVSPMLESTTVSTAYNTLIAANTEATLTFAITGITTTSAVNVTYTGTLPVSIVVKPAEVTAGQVIVRLSNLNTVTGATPNITVNVTPLKF